MVRRGSPKPAEAVVELMPCPYCTAQVGAKRLDKHIATVHADLANASEEAKQEVAARATEARNRPNPPEDVQLEPETYHVLSWEQVTGGVYLALGGRFRISRRGPGKWVLTDNATGEQMRFEFLRDAQRRAELILNEKL